MGNIYDHLVGTGDWGAEFYSTPLVIDIFKQRKIFLNFNNFGFTGHEVIRIGNEILIEPYTNYLSATSLWGMGAFSYSHSTWPDHPSGVRMGRYCSIAVDCRPIGSRHPIEWASSSKLTYRGSPSTAEWAEAVHNDFNDGTFESASTPKPDSKIDITIEHDVWMGSDVQLAQELIIGTGSVIGTGAIVTRNVEPYMIVGGIPARIIRPRFNEKLIEKFLASRWWEFGPNIWKLCDYKNPEKFVDDVARVREEQTITPFCPEKITFRHILNDLMNRV